MWHGDWLWPEVASAPAMLGFPMRCVRYVTPPWNMQWFHPLEKPVTANQPPVSHRAFHFLFHPPPPIQSCPSFLSPPLYRGNVDRYDGISNLGTTATLGPPFRVTIEFAESHVVDRDHNRGRHKNETIMLNEQHIKGYGERGKFNQDILQSLVIGSFFGVGV